MSTEKTSTLEATNKLQKNKAKLAMLKHGLIGLAVLITIVLYFWRSPQAPTVSTSIYPLQFTRFPYRIASASYDLDTVPTAHVYRDGLTVDNDVYINKDKITLVLHDSGLYTVVCVASDKVYIGSIYVEGDHPSPEPDPDPEPEPEPDPVPEPEVIDELLLQDLNGKVPSITQLKDLADNFDNISDNIEKGLYTSQSEMFCALVDLNQNAIKWLSTNTTEAETEAKWYAILGSGGFIDKYFIREGLTDDSELATFIEPLRVVAATMRRAQ